MQGESVTGLGVCKQCGEPILRGAQALYCSTPCRRRAAYHRRRAETLAARPPRVCDHCGELFAPIGYARFCSGRCQILALPGPQSKTRK